MRLPSSLRNNDAERRVTAPPPVPVSMTRASTTWLQRLRGRIWARIYNWHWIDGHRAARSSQLYGSHFGLLMDVFAIRGVVNLRGDNTGTEWYDAEQRACAARGIVIADVPVSSKRLPTRETLIGVLDAMDAAPEPLVMKCSGGADRAGFAGGVYLLNRYGRAGMAGARRQMGFWPFRHVPKKNQRWIRSFFDFVEADIDGRSLRDWIAGHYTDARFADFLRARGQGDYWAH